MEGTSYLQPALHRAGWGACCSLQIRLMVRLKHFSAHRGHRISEGVDMVSGRRMEPGYRSTGRAGRVRCPPQDRRHTRR